MVAFGSRVQWAYSDPLPQRSAGGIAQPPPVMNFCNCGTQNSSSPSQGPLLGSEEGFSRNMSISTTEWFISTCHAKFGEMLFQVSD